MPLVVQIIYDDGQIDPVSSLADVLGDALRERKVGLFKSEAHVLNSLKEVVHDLLRHHDVIVAHPPSIFAECKQCGATVTIWHSYLDGNILCTACRFPDKLYV
jgi:hypothetical protein